MRNPSDVLNSLSSKATDLKYQYQRLYRNLFNPQFYLLAYQHIYVNHGSMTPGIDGTTMDGMGMERINSIIEKLRDRSYQPLLYGDNTYPRKTGRNVRWGFPPRMTSSYKRSST